MKLKIDDEYFAKIDSERKAYFLGLLMADGWNTGRTLGIELKSDDGYILKELSVDIFGFDATRTRQRAMSHNRGIVIRPSPSTRLLINRASFCSLASKVGIIPTKSLTLRYPSLLPENLTNHFIRGYFDGDGCISVSTNKNVVRYRAHFISSKMFVDALISVIFDNCGMLFRVAKTKCKASAICLSGNRAVAEFGKWMYRDANIYLFRKKNRFDDLNGKISSIDAKKRYSMHRGVSFDKSRMMWTASARISGRSVSIGRYASESCAVDAISCFNQETEPVR